MRRNLIPEIGLTLCVVAVQLVGVLVLGWPAGNILLLLWFENLLLTLMTIPRMVVFRHLPEGGWGQVIGTAFGMLFLRGPLGVLRPSRPHAADRDHMGCARGACLPARDPLCGGGRRTQPR